MTTVQALESRYVDIVLDRRAVKVHYQDSGGLRSDLPPIVMLHGSGPAACGAHNFSQNIGHFIGLGFRVILVDWPGWGKSDSIVSKGSRSSLNAQVLHCVLDGIGVDRPVHIVGNSMGAHSATQFAIDNPGRIDKLILIGGGNGGRGIFQAAPTQGIQQIVAFYQRPSPQSMHDLLSIVTYKGASVSKEIVQARFEAAMARPDHIHSYCESIRANAMQYPDVSAQLPEINVPTLIFWGQEDRVVPLELGLRVATLMPNADMHIFSQCGHVPHMEQAVKFNHLAAWFLRDH